MPLAAARPAGLVDHAIEQLRLSITSGEWPVGTRIPTEPGLAAALGVGRNTVREAVRALAHSGILEVRRGDGTYVRATSEISGALSRMCDSKLREVLQVRRCLEVEGARLAAAARTEDDLAEMRQLLERRDTLHAGADRAEFSRADADLHFAVVRASHNEVLIELYRGLTEAVADSVAITSTMHHIGHTDLVEAIAEHDAERAGHEAGAFLDELIGELPEQVTLNSNEFRAG
ncbi:DNA-binding FadR family transcriptional regulator [Mycolicibacterium sp. BK556]|uniref:FadR/GntR family transcriptional regulator n=1 Tax=unclassified Mycolicibacterium TaxID=2636767 RepID=UPI0016173649|nr:MULTISPECIES: FCD domain-containing protein [unclassified Mycolicibacterium]MBB3603379.1 DNA-binding FadR family transcriptional regulator [Mycolicibacterium sp. BK556]MBB3633574.1 DNA-binding FadR family transcriptional regulator [Mycolicibacterium sp. BK607]